jgi:uncharacterized protein
MSSFDLSEDGTIEGFGAYFGNCDSHGDVIERGAFADTLANHKRAGTMPHMYLSHGIGVGLQEESLPIGVWTSAHEDSNGLYMKGRLALGNRRADDVHALVKSKSVTGLSIGYSPSRFQVMPKGSDVKRRLLAVHLVEVSVVHRPSNNLARVSRIKSAPAIRGLEHEFRERGHSREESKRLAREAVDNDALAQLAAMIRGAA